MGHTNSTVNYNLPQFVGTDKPSWLGDVNGAFLAIDTAIAAAKTEADSAAGGVASLQNTVGSHTTQIGTLTDTVTAQGGTLNSLTALIGNGEPTTTDKTIIGAINELNADLIKKVGASASGIPFSQQLTELYVVWQTLTDARKQRAYLKVGPSIMHVHNTNVGSFTNVNADSVNIYVFYFELSTAHFYLSTGTTVTDNSSVIAEQVLELYA